MIRRILALTFSVILALIISVPVSAHPGDTDAAGGHIDHSTGEYHYHHGYSAHQHVDGICPYDFDDKTSQSSSSSESGISSSISRTDTSTNSSIRSVTVYTEQLKAYEDQIAELEVDMAQLNKKHAYQIELLEQQQNISRILTYALFFLSIIVIWISVISHKRKKEAKKLQLSVASLESRERSLQRVKERQDNLIIDLKSTCSSQERDLAQSHSALEESKERTELAEAKTATYMHFIERFGANAEAFFSRPDAEPKLRRMMADYLTLVYDASADYLDQKERPAHVEAKRIRELKAETKEWIDRALRAEYELEKLSSHDK